MSPLVPDCPFMLEQSVRFAHDDRDRIYRSWSAPPSGSSDRLCLEILFVRSHRMKKIALVCKRSHSDALAA